MAGFALPRCALGVATAATQIEGGDLDTNWQRWAASGGIADGSSPARATDHWNRVAADTDLLTELGIRHYRMGLEWARLEPSPGRFDADAFAHYRDELARLRAAGITPLVTLHHFTTPGWFVDTGGWLGPGAVSVFLRFVDAVVRELGDQVGEWITINEPNVQATQGHLYGVWPPGERSYRGALAALRVLVEAHLRAYLLIHDLQPDAKVAVAHHLRAFGPSRPRNPIDRIATLASRRVFQDAVVRATSTGTSSWPVRVPRDLRPGRYADFLAINYYSRTTIRGLQQGVAQGVQVNDLGWEILPSGLIEVAEWVHARFPGPIWITENGTCDATDAFRARYIYEHLAQVADSDLPIERYYHWCFVDNWEWAEGEAARFGLVHLDFETQARTVKESGRFYADVIANAGVTAAAHARWVAGEQYPTNGGTA
jgi:beta-glucosidase